MRVTVLGWREAEERLAKDPNEFDAVISIAEDDGDKERPASLANVTVPILRLSFWDIEWDDGGKNSPSVSHVDRALHFARKVRAEKPDAHVLVHCAAGISRSAAVACTILCDERGEGSEKDVFTEVLQNRPQACPNILYIEWADFLMKRAGKMNVEADILRKNWGERLLRLEPIDPDLG